MIYSIGLSIYLILASPFYLLKVLRGKYRSNFFQRLGFGLKKIEGKTIWLHACSVGEIEAAAPFIELLMKEKKDFRIIISTVTETGFARAKKMFANLELRYLPFDFKFAIRKHLLTAGELDSFYIIETEIWPNLIRELSARKIPIFIVNGRISDRAWKRYRRFAFLFRTILRRISAVAARTELDAERYKFLGADRVEAVGNIKYDRIASALPRNTPQGRFVLFGSTHHGEEKICIEIFERLRKKIPELRAILAPRHIERAKELVKKYGGSLRSEGWDDSKLLILDTHGELAGMYAIAEAAFIGGSLVPVGGHNPLEAAIHSVPSIWGPYTENFRDACDVLKDNGGFIVQNGDELYSVFESLLTDNRLRLQCGASARKKVLENRGAAERTWKFFQQVTK